MNIKKKQISVMVLFALGCAGVTLSGMVHSADITCNGTLYYCGTNAGDNVTVSTIDPAKLTPLQGYGVYLNSYDYNLNDLTISTTGSASDAIFSNGNDGSYFIATGKVNILTTGSSADGVNLGVRGGPGSSSTYVSKNIAILSGSGGVISAAGMGVRANNNLAEGSKSIIVIGDGYTIKQTGTAVDNGSKGDGYAVYAGNRDQDISGFGTVDWLINGKRNNNKGDSYVFIGNDATISSAGRSTASYKGAAVYANKGGVIQLGNNVTITAPLGAYHLFASTEKQNIGTNNGGQVAEARRGLILLKGDTTANDGGDVGEVIFQAKGAGSQIKSGYLDYSYTSNDVIIDSTVNQSSGKFTLTGGLSAIEGGTIDLNFNDSSSFHGYTTLDTLSEIDLSIKGSKSIWVLSQDSKLTNLNLLNSAQVHLGDQSVDITPSNKITLTTKNLSGNGEFHLRTNIVGTGISTNNLSDLVKVTGTSAGNHTLVFKDNNTGSAILDGSERIRVVETEDGVANFALRPDSAVDIGAFTFNVTKGDSSYDDDNGIAERTSDWYLKAQLKGNGKPIINRTADKSITIFNINYLLGYAETQTLLQRMGELRRTPESKGNVWARAYTGKLNSFDDSLVSGFSLDYTGVQIGADKRVDMGREDDLYLGGFVGTSKADTNYKVGSADIESYTVGAYATYRSKDDFYVDGVIKYIHVNNSFDTVTSQNEIVKGDGSTDGYSLSVETGKRFWLQQPKAKWYIEPQAQLTASSQNSTTITASTGLKTNLDKYNSLIGRASVLFGYTLNNSSTNPVDVYVKTGYVKEFEGNTGYNFNGGKSETYKFNGDWLENGIGVTAQINKKNNIYVEGTYSTGSRFNQTQINAGYRYCF